MVARLNISIIIYIYQHLRSSADVASLKIGKTLHPFLRHMSEKADTVWPTQNYLIRRYHYSNCQKILQVSEQIKLLL